MRFLRFARTPAASTARATVTAGTAVVLVLAAFATACADGADGAPAARESAGPAGAEASPVPTGTWNPPEPKDRRWPAPPDPSRRAAEAGLPMLHEEGQLLHIHAHLDVIVEGSQVEVPANIGIDIPARQISPLHTHDTTGIVHVESPKEANFTLGQFMTEWGVDLTADSIGGLVVKEGKILAAYVDGKKHTGDPADIRFADRQQIALIYGTPEQHADPPATYDWPEGL